MHGHFLYVPYIVLNAVACSLSSMALVPFRVSGPASDQTVEQRIFQIGQYSIYINQDVHSSGSLQGVSQHHCSLPEHKSGGGDADMLLLEAWHHAQQHLTDHLLQIRKRGKSSLAMLAL